MQTALGEGKGVLSSDTQALNDTAHTFLMDGAGDKTFLMPDPARL